MEKYAIAFHGRKITVNGLTWKVPYRIKNAFLSGGRVVVIYEPTEKIFEYFRGKYHSMEGFTLDGKRLWVAEYPMQGSGSSDMYVEFMSVEPLIVWSFSCFRCKIDPETGTILHSEFTK